MCLLLVILKTHPAWQTVFCISWKPCSEWRSFILYAYVWLHCFPECSHNVFNTNSWLGLTSALCYHFTIRINLIVIYCLEKAQINVLCSSSNVLDHTVLVFFLKGFRLSGTPCFCSRSRPTDTCPYESLSSLFRSCYITNHSDLYNNVIIIKLRASVGQ